MFEMEPEEILDGTPALKRKLVWDTLPCSVVVDFFPKMGLIPPSDEGVDMEHEESHHRINELIPIATMVQILSSLTGEIIGRAILDSQEEEVSPEELSKYATLVYAGSVAVLANLIDMDQIHINAGVLP